MHNEIRNTLLKIPIPDLMREAGAYMDELQETVARLERKHDTRERRLWDLLWLWEDQHKATGHAEELRALLEDDDE